MINISGLNWPVRLKNRRFWCGKAVATQAYKTRGSKYGTVANTSYTPSLQLAHSVQSSSM